MLLTDSEVARVEQLAAQAYEQGGQAAYVAVVCYMYHDHFAYLGSGYEAKHSSILPFSPDWHRFRHPCFQHELFTRKENN